MKAAWLGFALIASISLAAMAQVTILPGDSDTGARLFKDKGCVQCHSFSGPGAGTSSPSELAGKLWNHSPSMWAAQRSADRSMPQMTSTDTADLFAYFYSLLYFSRSGKSTTGRVLFERRCSSCHSTGTEKWTLVKDRMIWAERMWNHSGEMSEKLGRNGTRWPVFSGQEMADLMTYFESLPSSGSETPAFRSGNPAIGLAVFERNCEACHTFGAAAGRKVDLLATRPPGSFVDYAAAMWNHAPVMNRQAQAAFPRLAEGEMSDLTAYLFAQRYFAERGNPRRGERVYADKGCAGCHDQRPLGSKAPDLSQVTERFSPITLTSALWRSGPAMLEAIKQRKMEWPQFRPSEMNDLIAFLNERQITRIGK